jgi:putative membrane protein
MTADAASAVTPRRLWLQRLGVGLVALGGLALAVVLIGEAGFLEVGRAFAKIGWGLLVIVAYDVAALACAGLGWRALLSGAWRAPAGLAIYLRYLREAINNLLPVAQVGGDLIAARILAKSGAPASLAVASVIADKTVETMGQFLFTLAGFVLLIGRSDSSDLTGGIALGLLLAAPALLAFFAVQNSRVFAGFERLLLALASRMQWGGLAQMAGLHGNLVALYRNPVGVLVGFVYHAIAWAAGAGEIWLALHLMGQEISLGDAFILESLGQAARSAAFVIPGGLGAQEGAFLLVGQALGLPADYALAASLVKRASQLLFGLPLLASWPWAERRKIAAV